MRTSLSLIILWLLILNATAQTPNLPVFVTDSLDGYIQSAMKDWNIPAMSVGIVKDGKVIYCKGFGVLENGKPEKVDENTLFMIGSNTKLFTGTMAALLEQNKTLSLDDKVSKWLPEFKLNNAIANSEATITDLLSHRIGFETFQGDFTYWTSDLSRAQVVEKMSKVEALYPFRTKWGYCNAGFLTTGQIIEKATGKSWEENIRNYILTPLKMNRTLMLAKELVQAKNVAKPYTWYNNKLTLIDIPMLDNLAPAGSISSSAMDMCKWLKVQLDLGKLDNKEILSPNAILKTRQPQSIVYVNNRNKALTHFTLYGLGVELTDRNGTLTYNHTGGVNGYLSSVVIIPEQNLGIVALTTNDYQEFFQLVTNQIQDAFLGVPYQNYSKPAALANKQALEEERNMQDSLQTLVNNEKLPLKQELFLGKYQNELYGFVEIKKGDQNSLCMSFQNHSKMTARLDYIGNNEFLITYSDITMGVRKIPFTIEKNKVTGFTLYMNPFVEFTPYKFAKTE